MTCSSPSSAGKSSNPSHNKPPSLRGTPQPSSGATRGREDRHRTELGEVSKTKNRVIFLEVEYNREKIWRSAGNLTPVKHNFPGEADRHSFCFSQALQSGYLVFDGTPLLRLGRKYGPKPWQVTEHEKPAAGFSHPDTQLHLPYGGGETFSIFQTSPARLTT
jgi:hypothetical protein